MTMLIIADGPEKSGKTTVLKTMCDIYGWHYHHNGPVDPDDRAFAAPLLDCLSHYPVSVWDRGWPSEFVYALLLERKDRRMRLDPFIGEWLYGRAARFKFMFLGETRPHDATDLPVDPVLEKAAFTQYQRDFMWAPVDQKHNDAFVAAFIGAVHDLVQKKPIFNPLKYGGPEYAPVVFVEDRPVRPLPGGILPFSDSYSLRFAKELGQVSFKCGWTAAHFVPPHYLQNRIVVSCGDKAYKWATYYVRPQQHIAFGSLRHMYISISEKLRADKVQTLKEQVLDAVAKQSYPNYLLERG